MQQNQTMHVQMHASWHLMTTLQGLDEDALAMLGEFVEPAPPAASPGIQQMGEQTTDARQPQGTTRRTRRAYGSVSRRRPAGPIVRPKVPAPARAADGPDVLAKVAGIVTTVLGSEVGHDQPLMAAGLDSLGAVELRNALAAAFGTELPPTVTLDYPTVSALAGHIASVLDRGVTVPAAATEDGEEEDAMHAEVWVAMSCLCSVCFTCAGALFRFAALHHDQHSTAEQRRPVAFIGCRIPSQGSLRMRDAGFLQWRRPQTTSMMVMCSSPPTQWAWRIVSAQRSAPACRRTCRTLSQHSWNPSRNRAVEMLPSWSALWQTAPKQWESGARRRPGPCCRQCWLRQQASSAAL